TKAAARLGPPLERAMLSRKAALLPWNPESARALGRPGAFLLGLLRRVRSRLLASGFLHIGHLQARQRVAHRRELLAVLGLEQRQQRSCGVDRQLDLARIGGRALGEA